MRVKLTDTIILLNIKYEICLTNAYNTVEEYIKKGTNRNDMAKCKNLCLNSCLSIGFLLQKSY